MERAGATAGWGRAGAARSAATAALLESGAAGNGLTVVNGQLTKGGWQALHEERAVVLAGLNRDRAEFWGTGFQRASEGYQAIVLAGAGTAAHNPNDGGSVLVATTAAANGDMSVLNGGFKVSAIKTKRWYIASRGQIATAPDNNSLIWPVLLYDGTGVNPNGMFVSGASPTLTLRLGNGGATTDLVTSWTVDTGSAHDFAIGFDLSTVTAYVDGVAVGTQTNLANMGTSDGEIMVRSANGATAAIRSFRVYSLHFGLEPP
jgi:hypothetical protein